MQYSDALLAERGNMSGASNIAALHRVLQSPEAAGLTHAVGLAYGEGITQEGVVFELLQRSA
jgi:predicted naringenin-chalcone synthase